MVVDMDQSINFYQSIGFKLANRWGNYYAQLAAPGITIGLHPSKGRKEDHQCNLSLGFTAENFEAVADKLTSLSIDFTLREEEGGKFIHFYDPDGLALYFVRPKTV